MNTVLQILSCAIDINILRDHCSASSICELNNLTYLGLFPGMMISMVALMREKDKMTLPLAENKNTYLSPYITISEQCGSLSFCLHKKDNRRAISEGH